MTFERMNVLLAPENREQATTNICDAGMLRDDVDELLNLASLGLTVQVTRPETVHAEIQDAHKRLDEMNIPRGEIHDGGFASFNLLGRLSYVKADCGKARFDGKTWNLAPFKERR